MKIKNSKWDTHEVPEGVFLQSKKSQHKSKIEEMSAEKKTQFLSSELSDEDFSKNLCSLLKESNRSLMSKLFKFLGRERALLVYQDTYKIQASNGMLNSDVIKNEDDLTKLFTTSSTSTSQKGKSGQYRTPGGVYLQLVKGIPTKYGIEPEEAKKLIKSQKRFKEKEKKMTDFMSKLDLKL